MNQKIFTGLLLIIIGILVGLFVLTAYQFHQRLQNIENYVLSNDQKISQIETFINSNLVKQPSNSDNVGQ